MIHCYETTQILCSTHANDENNPVLCARPHVIMFQPVIWTSEHWGRPPPPPFHAFHRVLNGLKLLDIKSTLLCYHLASKHSKISQHLALTAQFGLNKYRMYKINGIKAMIQKTEMFNFTNVPIIISLISNSHCSTWSTDAIQSTALSYSPSFVV